MDYESKKFVKHCFYFTVLENNFHTLFSKKKKDLLFLFVFDCAKSSWPQAFL